MISSRAAADQSAAEQARAQTDLEIPETGIEALGGDSPEAAMDNFIGAVADLDLEGMVATLNPNEFEALQRYGPLLIDDGQREIDDGLRESDVSIDVSDTTYTVSGEGTERSVSITGFSVDISAEGDTLSGRLEDGCFIGARAEVAEGVIVREGAVLAMGVYLSASTKIVDRATGEVVRGEVPAYSVVVPGSLPDPNGGPSLYCAVIVKRVDAQTRAKTGVNELLRD